MSRKIKAETRGDYMDFQTLKVRKEAAMKRGFQTRDAEMNLAKLVGDLEAKSCV